LDSTPLIELRNVTKQFGDKVVLDGLNLKLYDGEALAVIGPSGTGKSTVLRIICGLLEPDSGEVLIDGKPTTDLLHNGKVRLGMVFQQAALFDSLTVGENVGFLLYEKSRLPAAKIRELITQTLEQVGLRDIEDLYPARLSGGQRKRVSFARAILTEPGVEQACVQVLLYDEPTAGLDPIASTVIEDLIRNLYQGHNACIIVTHQQSTIRRTADRVLLLHDGQVRWEGGIAEIDTTPNPYIQQFFAGSTVGPIQ